MNLLNVGTIKLKSDYIRIEIGVAPYALYVILGLKSDYIRIEIC